MYEVDSEKSADIVLKPSCQNHPSLDVDLSEQRFVTATLVVLQVFFVCWYSESLAADDAVLWALLAHFAVQVIRCIGMGRERDALMTSVGSFVYALFAFTFLFSNLLSPLGATVGLERLGYLLGTVWPGFLLGIYGRSWDREKMYFSPHRRAP